MKSLMFIRRCCLPIVAVLVAGGLRAQAPDDVPAGTPTPGKPKYAALENELAMYSPFESPWAEIKVNHAFETHLFNLLRAEVRLWALQSQLAAQDGPARDTAEEVSRIIHAQILGAAADALPMLQKTPNRPFALLLVHQLEAYPYEWKEEGAEDLLPSLHKLVGPPVDKPRPEEGRRTRRRRSSSDKGEPSIPAAPAAVVPR